MNNNLPLFFKSRDAKSNPAQNALLYDICRATSAGPTYLPSYPMNFPNNNEDPQRNCIDGGVFVNNPSMAAVSEFSKHFKEYLPDAANQTDIDYDRLLCYPSAQELMQTKFLNQIQKIKVNYFG